MNKLTILVICAVVGTAVAQSNHRHSRSWSSKGNHAENGAAADANANVQRSLGGPGGLYAGLGGPGGFAAGLGGFNGAQPQDPKAAINVLLGADGKPATSGSYQWSHSTSGGANGNAGARIETPANVNLNLGPLGGLTNAHSAHHLMSTSSLNGNIGGLGYGNVGVGGPNYGAQSAVSSGFGGMHGGFKGVQSTTSSLNGNIAGPGYGNVGVSGLKLELPLVEAAIRGRSKHRRHSSRGGPQPNPQADILNLNLAGLNAGIGAGVLGARNPNAPVSLTVNGVQFIQIGNKYYWIDIANAVNWHAAHAACRRNNAQLATIQSDAEMKAINDFLTVHKLNKRQFWLAGNDLAEENKFVWVSNGQVMSYAKWSPGQPDNYKNNEHCVGLWDKHGPFLMNDFQCSDKSFVICEADTSCM